jgi:tetrahydromethanopterin S-methyltransferase subunit G
MSNEQTLSKSLDIIAQIEALPLNETPVFTWDEAKKMEDKAEGKGVLIGLCYGIVAGLILLLIADWLTGGKVLVK